MIQDHRRCQMCGSAFARHRCHAADFIMTSDLIRQTRYAA